MHKHIPVWSRYLGEPWTPAFDCWALVRVVYAEELGISLPSTGLAAESVVQSLRKIATHPIRSRFVRVEAPQHMDIAEFSSSDSLAYHMGVYLLTPDGPKILHNPKGGVVLERPRQVVADLTYWRYQHG